MLPPTPSHSPANTPGLGSSAQQVQSPESGDFKTDCSVWRDTLKYISRRVTKQAFATWLKPTRSRQKSLANGDATIDIMEIGAPNQFVVDWLKENYLSLIEEALMETSGKKFQVDFCVSQRLETQTQTEISFDALDREITSTAIVVNGSSDSFASRYTSPGATSSPTKFANIQPGLHDRYRFDHLVVGNFNEFAYAASVAVSDNPGGTKYNPLVIYGGVGLGKTHLAQSIGQAVLTRSPNLRVKYATSEKFTTDFITSLASSTTADFVASYRSVDVLLIDDIQFFSGKESTQEQFFHTFNALYNAGKQIVLTADRRPQDIKGLEARLLSRFTSGLIADIQAPDLESRIAILQKKLAEYDFRVDEDILHLIASHVTSNVRELEGALTHLYAKASLEKIGHVNLDFASTALSDLIISQRKSVSVDGVLEKVSESFEVPLSALKSKKRTADVALARQTAMHIIRSLTDRSLQKIGQDFGGRDHSTVIHACSLISDKIERDSEFKRQVEQIIDSLR